MHTSLHSSQKAFALSVTGVPTGRSAGTLIVVNNNVSPSYPKFINGPTGNRFGCGQSIGPALKPAGSCHLIWVGSPESPGTCQYVCHSLSCFNRSPTVSG